MPHDALAAAPTVRGRRPDVILGDRFGAACARTIMETAAEAFRAAGFAVARNAPFAGAYILQRHGRPEQGLHAIQIEIDRALYLDEKRIAPGPRFEGFCRVMAGIVADIAALGGRAGESRLAAE